MLNTLYGIFITLSLLYFLFSSRKEVPTLVLTQALLQYVWTLGMWSLRLSQQMTGILLGFMVATSLLLIWASRLAFSRQALSLSLFVGVSQWAVLLMLAVLIGLRSPYYYTTPLFESYLPFANQALSIHPAIKLSGNLMLFMAFFHLILGRREHWSIRNSLLKLGPALVYFCLALFLRYTQAANPDFPVT